MPKTLSIIISCYNDLNVTKAIAAAAKQTVKSKEIIVIDDGSDEITKEAIIKSKKNIDVLVEQENSGQSIARNNGIKKSSGHYILNWDSDDYFEPEFAEKAIPKFEENKEVKIVTCKARRFNLKGTIDYFSPRGGTIDNFLIRNSALGSSMFKKADWMATGGYEEELPILGFEDWEFYIQLLKSGGYAYVLPEVLFHYQVRENNTTARIKDLRQDKFRHIILKHQDLYKNNFDLIINELFWRIKNAEDQNLNNRNIVGTLKSLFKKLEI